MHLPPYTSYPNLTRDSIALREFLQSDLESILEISFYDGIQAVSLEDASEMHEKINADYQRGESIHWIIVDQSRSEAVGTCGYYRGFRNGTGELGCVLLPQFRGHGYMTDALVLAIDFGFNQVGLRQIDAITINSNHKAIRLLERLQFVRIGEEENNGVKFSKKRT